MSGGPSLSYCIEPVGTIHSCFSEKFGIPRQPGLVPEATAVLELLPPYNHADSVRGLEAFSHIWLQFIFHGIAAGKWQPLVRPPRLGGNRKLGVFASRSTHRPNGLGLSVVRLDRVDCRNGVRLHLSGIDLLDGTPVIDIKPYIPYADALQEATGGFADSPPRARLRVSFAAAAAGRLAALSVDQPTLPQLIEKVLALDPRPAYSGDGDGERVYGVRLHGFDIRWRVRGECVEVVAIV